LSFAGAARNGHVDVVEYLLQWQHQQQLKQQQEHDDELIEEMGGCDDHDGNHHHYAKNAKENNNYNLLEATTLEGTTAFCWAAWQAHQDVLEALYRADCNVQATNDYGCNAILWCAQGGGGDGGEKDGDTTTTNDSAATSTCSRLCYTMEWLQSVGCRINQVNSNGHSLVHKAAQRGRRDILNWFFDKMHSAIASCDTTPDFSENGQPMLSVHQLLQLVGPDSDGCTPSDLAGMEGHDELADWITTEMEARLVTAVAAIEVSTRATGPQEEKPRNDEKLLPSWLEHDPLLPPVNSCPNNMMYNSCRWGPWAGVRLMRAIWNQAISMAEIG
jgi:hypothetical protein